MGTCSTQRKNKSTVDEERTIRRLRGMGMTVELEIILITVMAKGRRQLLKAWKTISGGRASQLIIESSGDGRAMRQALAGVA